MANLWQSLLRRFRNPRRPAPAGGMGPSVPHIMQQLSATETVELTCDDVLRLMDEAAEAALRGEDVARLMPLFQRHLDLCGDCREEYAGLLRILRAENA